jgi:hypothetical protein
LTLKNKINEVGDICASCFGLKERKAIYREGLGATLIDDNFDVNKSYDTPKKRNKSKESAFPYGNQGAKIRFCSVDYAKLNLLLCQCV